MFKFGREGDIGQFKSTRFLSPQNKVGLISQSHIQSKVVREIMSGYYGNIVMGLCGQCACTVQSSGGKVCNSCKQYIPFINLPDMMVPPSHQ